jgi:hypothetical protein
MLWRLDFKRGRPENRAMFLAFFLTLTTWLYSLCFLLVAALLVLILWRRPRVQAGESSRRSRHRARLHAAFFRLALALWGWQLTLFAETRIASPEFQLQLGASTSRRWPGPLILPGVLWVP